MAKTTTAPEKTRTSRRMKCACTSCQCTVDMDKATRRDNLVFCSKACAEKACSHESCRCEHDQCS